ncbi:uncharacterized protein LOC125020160 isoform X2 [Mugil cephalus]|uniref:uncharacterized protein LOC125020160 isoform X2 n=1 Tax=Mugil cephalus TaxID=48193 RepID=UPI001FB6529E|nr:uncharacterized protein LOC125020160 isoform X2 [Mugil cephalus]
MLSLFFFCLIWFLLGCIQSSTGTLRPPEVIRLSVPEDHHVCLPCSDDSWDVVWTLRDRKVLVTRRGDHQTNEDRQHYILKSDGVLCLLKLDDSDSGEYRCNQRLEAELQVLTGQTFRVSAGRTLLLSCNGSSARNKQRWLHQRVGGRRPEAILTRFRNGTVRLEREEDDDEEEGRSRFSFVNDSLQIQNLQPEDAGEYLCNGVLQAKVSVLPVSPETTSVQSETRTSPESPTATDVFDADKKKKKKKKRKKSSENALLLVAVVGLALMVVLMAAVCVLLSGMKLRRKRRKRQEAGGRREDTELQPWKTSRGQTESESLEEEEEEETIHYASLGRHNWRERPSRTPPDQNHHSVIYSSIITR